MEDPSRCRTSTKVSRVPADWGIPRRRTGRWILQCGVMTFYLPNTDVRPTGFEPAEFIDPDLPPRAANPVAERLADDQEITDVIIRAAKETR